MIKIISIILFGLILCPAHYSQQKTFGYKISGNGDIVSDVFLIQNGFVLDSAVINNKTYKYEYDDKGKLKRDYNYVIFNTGLETYVPAYRNYFYNESGKIDSILYERWDNTLQMFRPMDGWIKNFYDNEGKLISKISDNGTTIKVEENSYDSYGNLILNKITIAGDTAYNFREYDSQDRLILIKSIHNSSLYYTKYIYQYDSSGNINYTNQEVSPNYTFVSEKKYFVFDKSGKVINEIHRSPTDSVEILFDYDEQSRIIKMGEHAWFHYNADGNLDTLVNPPVTINRGYLADKATLIDSYGNEITFPQYDGHSPYIDEHSYFYYSKLITSVKKAEREIKNFVLFQNYPNPFNPITTITYSLPKSSFVTLTIYDLLGREVTTLVNEEKHSGTYKITWNAQNIPSGVYFYKITAGDYSKVNKMILLK